jgi:hypothetical protein
VSMHLAYAIQSRRGRAFAVLMVVRGILVAAVLLLSGKSPRPFEMDDLYGVLD